MFFFNNYSSEEANEDTSQVKSNSHPKEDKYLPQIDESQPKLRLKTFDCNGKLRKSSDSELGNMRQHRTIQTARIKLEDVDMAMTVDKKTLKKSVCEIKLEDEQDTVSLDWTKEQSETSNLKIHPCPSMSRRHSINVDWSSGMLKSSISSTQSAYIKSRTGGNHGQRRRSIVWADETKTHSLETVYFIARRSRSFDQSVSLLIKTIGEKYRNITK